MTSPLQPCPLHPGVMCAATYELALSSKCIGCDSPFLTQIDRDLIRIFLRRGC
ncbi:MAG: hypothetical protein PHI67_05105 [Candidatus Methanomethylophilaceae archaeon]|jgi:hypothetical protein|nr:hypothetical protein [Candidatus Methanomethylophilaceae archaeon]